MAKIKKKFEKLKNLKNVNLIQFVPAIFIMSLVVNSITGYTMPEAVGSPVGETKVVKAKTGKENDQNVSMGDLDLSKIKDGTYKGTGTGFRGKITVEVTVKSHKITDIEVLSSSDDSAYINRASDGVIKSIIKEQSLNVDVVSGATYSSKGILAAVKNALTGVEDTSTAAGAGSGLASAKKIGKVNESGQYKDGTYIGTGTGFRGTVKVSVTIKTNKIKTIKVLSSKDDNAYFNRASGSILPAILKKQTTNVDTVSGATYSSNGIIEAVRDALKKAEVTSKDTSTDGEEKENQDTDLKLVGNYKDGTYEGTGTGFKGQITMSVTIKDNRMTNIKVVKNEKDDISFFEKACAVIQLMLQKQDSDVDVVSGATYSSNGIKEAVKNALKKAQIDDSSEDDSQEEDKDMDDPSKEEEDAETPSEEENNAATVVYIGSAICYPDEYEDFMKYDLSLEVVVTDGKVTGIQNIIGSGKDYIRYNDQFISMAKNGIIPQLLKGKSTSQCDVVSGATCTSKAILEAYEQAVSQIK